VREYLADAGYWRLGPWCRGACALRIGHLRRVSALVGYRLTYSHSWSVSFARGLQWREFCRGHSRPEVSTRSHLRRDATTTQGTSLIVDVMSLLRTAVPGLTPGSGGAVGSRPLFELRQLILLQLDEPKGHQHPHVVVRSGATARIPSACRGIARALGFSKVPYITHRTGYEVKSGMVLLVCRLRAGLCSFSVFAHYPPYRLGVVRKP